MRNYRLRCCEDKIGISVLGIMTTPNYVNTSMIHCRVSGCRKMVQITKYGMRILTVIDKQSGKLVKMDRSTKYVYFILTKNGFLTF